MVNLFRDLGYDETSEEVIEARKKAAEFHYWRYSDPKRVKDARNMANMRIAWRKIAGVFLDEATRLLNKMTDWLKARYKK